MMNSNKKTNKYVMVIICITFTLSMFYLSTKAVIYILNKRDVEGFVKWFTEFGHLNRGDMLTSEQHRCHNEKKKFQRRV